jgi:hypothetical protein
MTITFTNGTTTADGTEQTLWDVTSDDHFSGAIFTHNMLSGDTLEIRQYILDINASTMRLYAINTLSGAQTATAFYLPFLATKEHKVTIKQTAGTNRAYTWYRAVVA